MTGSSFVEFAFSWFPRFIGLPVKGSLVPFGFSFTSCPLAQAFTLSAFQTGCFEIKLCKPDSFKLVFESCLKWKLVFWNFPFVV